DGLPVVFAYQVTGIVIDPAPILNAVIQIYRWTDVNQLSDFEAFESFDAEKTEDAVDKLIMLKQEGWFRAAMNLIAVPELSKVVLVNDKGDDAHILIWNEHTEDSIVINDAGVFAGLVTTNMPCPGAVVEKPDHFAYFQYGLGGREVLLTSRAYPIEVIDGYSASFTVENARIVEQIVEGYNGIFTLGDGTLRLAIKSTEMDPEGYEGTFTPIDATLRAAIKSTVMDPEGYEGTYTLQDGTLRIALVQHSAPTEAYEGTFTILSGTLT
ncbi:unnamed protein product, partial [marine sediment metagenome]